MAALRARAPLRPRGRSATDGHPKKQMRVSHCKYNSPLLARAQQPTEHEDGNGNTGANTDVQESKDGYESASDTSGPTSSSQQQSQKRPSDMSSTLQGLDAILGESAGKSAQSGESRRKRSDNGSSSAADESSEPKIEISKRAIEEMAEAERKRLGKTQENERVSDFLDQLNDIASRASEEGSGKDSERAFLEGVRNTFAEASQGDTIPKRDLESFKDRAFGVQTFWVTGVERSSVYEGGAVFTGNLRDDRARVFKDAEDAAHELFGNKYVVFMVPERDALPSTPSSSGGVRASSSSSSSSERVAFVLVRGESASAPPTALWQYAVSIVLLLLNVGSSLQLGLVAQISKLPPEVLKYLNNPQLSQGQIPEEIANIDLSPFVVAALPTAIAVMFCTGAHEAAHWAVAKLYNMRINIPFLIPNGQIGTFGSVTQLKEPARKRRDLFDFAIAGPAAGVASGAVLFAYGLYLSSAASSGNGIADASALVSVPTQVFNGSLMLGAIAKQALPLGSVQGPDVMVHPYLLAGWCALTTSALNLLPVGRLDGGRAVQSALGSGPLGITSFFTYLGLALGLLGGNLSSAWGLFVLIVQSNPEAPPRDNASSIDRTRQLIALVAIAFAVGILLPGGATQQASLASGGPAL